MVKHTAILLNPNKRAFLTRSLVGKFLVFISLLLLANESIPTPTPSSSPYNDDIAVGNIPNPVTECSYRISGRDAKEFRKSRIIC